MLGRTTRTVLQGGGQSKQQKEKEEWEKKRREQGNQALCKLPPVVCKKEEEEEEEKCDDEGGVDKVQAIHKQEHCAEGENMKALFEEVFAELAITCRIEGEEVMWDQVQELHMKYKTESWFKQMFNMKLKESIETEPNSALESTSAEKKDERCFSLCDDGKKKEAEEAKSAEDIAKENFAQHAIGDEGEGSGKSTAQKEDATENGPIFVVDDLNTVLAKKRWSVKDWYGPELVKDVKEVGIWQSSDEDQGLCQSSDQADSDEEDVKRK